MKPFEKQEKEKAFVTIYKNFKKRVKGNFVEIAINYHK